MKKKISIVLLIILTIAINICACEKPKTALEILKEEISFLQEGLYIGSCENYNVTLTKVKKEESFIADGLVGNLIKEDTLSVKPTKMELLNKSFTYSLKGESGVLEGALIKDVLGITFSAEIENLDSIGNIISVTIICDEGEECIEFLNALKGSIDFTTALEVAYVAFKEKLDTELQEKPFKREIYIKIINSDESEIRKYYWYISFLKNTDDFYSVLVDSKTGEISSKREKVAQ